MASSKIAIYSALFANLAIAVTKFIAAAITGSSAMLSEGIHSVVDTGNEILLLFGISRSKKPPDAKRPFGYGRELYFWSFIVSLLIFSAGGVISFYEGIIHLQHPEIIKNPLWNYVVLAIALMFDGTSFIIALKQFNKQRGEQRFWEAIKKSKDPTDFVVLFEDASDVLGLLVAFAGIWLGNHFKNPYFDGTASLIIGLILAGISIVLAKESYSLLMGEAASPEVLNDVTVIIKTQKHIDNVKSMQSVFLGPEEIVLVIHIMFANKLSIHEGSLIIESIKKNIQHKYPYFKQIVIEPDEAYK